MKRALEPELMEDAAQAIAYAKANFSSSNQLFVDILCRGLPAGPLKVLDIGCGPGDVMFRLLKALPDISITAIDGSSAMIEIAVNAIQSAGQQKRVIAQQGYIPGVSLKDGSFDAILSKDLLHHLPDPMVLWREVRRLGKRGGSAYVMDLIRPSNQREALKIVEAVAPNEHRILKEDFYNSLCAAFTLDEVSDQLRATALPFEVSAVSDRHMMIRGTIP